MRFFNKVAVDKAAPPCLTTLDPLGLVRSSIASYELKFFDVHHNHINDAFPYKLHPGTRLGTQEMPYLEFKSPRSAENYTDIGFPGDIWVKKTGGKGIYYKIRNDKWVQWRGTRWSLLSAQSREQAGFKMLFASVIA